ncbi:hypothetical protein [Flavonifractor sp. An306]|uniref:hypothetical protein n=1 Tax=Flavonifractor sp. An306 TaxID=1965629 RepID=UPI00174D62A7|nr:hypothetical protein [Flavonifractor sp. An306]
MAQTTKWVRWTQWSAGGLVGVGQMPLYQVQQNLQRFEQMARKLLAEKDADHVLYGVKNYDDNGELEEIKFYLEPMDEERFERDVARVQGVTVYAVHRME